MRNAPTARECVTPRGGMDTKNLQAAQKNGKENKTPGEKTLSVNDKVPKKKGVQWNSVCGTIFRVGAGGTSSQSVSPEKQNTHAVHQPARMISLTEPA